MTETIFFWVFAIPLIVAAAGVVIFKNPINAAMSLVASLFFLAAIYVLLSAHLIAFLQVLVYAGAIMVLFLFVIMLLSLSREELEQGKPTLMKALGVLGALALGALVIQAVRISELPAPAAVNPEFGTVKAVGKLIFTHYLLPFEAVSLLLLVAIVGAVVVAKEKI